MLYDYSATVVSFLSPSAGAVVSSLDDEVAVTAVWLLFVVLLLSSCVLFFALLSSLMVNFVTSSAKLSSVLLPFDPA